MLPSVKSNEEENQSKNSVHVKLLLDVSGSMEDYMVAYIKKVQSVVTKIVQSAESWQIDITSFHTSSDTRIFSSDSHNLQSITKFLPMKNLHKVLV